MIFSQLSQAPEPLPGEAVFSLEEQYVIHPLHIESVFDNWRQAGERRGRRGESTSSVSFKGDRSKAVFALNYDLPNSPRQLDYQPMAFRVMYLNIQAPLSCRVVWRIYSAYPAMPVFPELGELLGEHSFELGDAAVLAVELESGEVPYATCFELEITGADEITVTTPCYLAAAETVAERLRKRYAEWSEKIDFDLALLKIHQSQTSQLINLAAQLKARALDFSLAARDETAAGFARWPRLLEPVWRRLGALARVKVLQKRARLLKLDVENALAALAEHPDLTKIDRLETVIQTAWEAANFPVKRDGKVIYTAENERLSLMGINDYDIATNQPCREDAYLYMQLLGYRLIRQPVRDLNFDYERGGYDEAYVQKYVNSARLAARYGLTTILELHYVPAKIMQAMRHSPEGGCFFDALECEEWIAGQLQFWVNLLKNQPSLAIVEVPINEPFLRGNSRRLTPADPQNLLPGANTFWQAKWDQYITGRYRDPAALAAQWGELGEGESFGHFAFPTDNIYESKRLGDYIDFFVTMYTQCCRRLAALVKGIAPGKLVAMAQPSQSGIFSLEKIRLDGIYLYQNIPDNIDLVTIHYNLGQSSRLFSLDRPGYLGEEYAQDLPAWESAWQKQGGLLPWGWSTRWRKGEDLIDLDGSGYLWPDKRHLALNQERLLHYPTPRPVSAVILTSKRLIARGCHHWRQTRDFLHARNLDADIFDQDAVIERPELLNGYQFAIVENEFGDRRLPAVLRQTHLTVLYLGTGAYDYHGHTGKESFFGALKGLIPINEVSHDDKLDLSTMPWRQGIIRQQRQNRYADERLMFSQSSAIAADQNIDLNEVNSITDWHPFTLPLPPGAEDRYYLKLEFDLPPNWQPEDEFELFAAGLDDFDWCFVNGELVGGEQTTWNQAWHPHRSYTVRPGLLKHGGNVILWRIQRHTGLNGIYDLPVELRRRAAGAWQSDEFDLSGLNGKIIAAAVNIDNFSCPVAANILARSDNTPILINHGREFLYLRQPMLQNGNHFDQAVWQTVTGRARQTTVSEVAACR